MINFTTVLPESSTTLYQRAMDTAEAFRAPCDLFRLIVGTLGLVANFVMFYIFSKFPSLRNPANDLLLSMGVNDVLSIINDLSFIMLNKMEVDYGHPIKARLPCFIRCLGTQLTFINISQLVAIAFERFLFIAKPLHYYSIIARWKRTIIIVSWVWPLALSSPLVYVFNCAKLADITLWYAIYGSYILAMFVLIAALYCYVFLVARKQVKSVHRHVPRSFRHSNLKEITCNLRLLKGYSVIVGTAFLAYCLPVVSYLMFLLHMMAIGTALKMMFVAGAVLTLNNSINPFVYVYSQHQFQEAVKILAGKTVDSKQMLLSDCMSDRGGGGGLNFTRESAVNEDSPRDSVHVIEYKPRVINNDSLV